MIVRHARCTAFVAVDNKQVFRTIVSVIVTVIVIDCVDVYVMM